MKEKKVKVKVKKPRKSKVDKAKDAAELARFGTSYVMSLKPVQQKITKSEEKPKEESIFDFSWKQGEKAKMGKKEKKAPKDHKMDMSFMNVRSKRYLNPK